MLKAPEQTLVEPLAPKSTYYKIIPLDITQFLYFMEQIT